MKYSLPTGTNSSRSKRPLKFKVLAYCFKTAGGSSAKEAIQQAAEECGVTDLPESYIKHSGSHIWAFKNTIAKELDKGNEEVLTLLRENGVNVNEEEEETVEE